MGLNFLHKDNRSWLMGIAIIWIILMHANMFPALYDIKDVYFMNLFFSNGALGVDIFLFLSSYGLCHSLAHKKLHQFYKSRLQRIFPLYWFFLLIIILCFPTIVQDSPVAFFLKQTTGLSCIQSIRIEWYVPALILLYLFFPLLYKVINFICSKNLINLIICLIIFLMRFESKVPIDSFFLTRIPIIILGITTYQYRNNHTLLLQTYGSAIFASLLFTQNIRVLQSMTIPVLLVISDNYTNKLPFRKAITFVGKHSFEIYLAQNIAFNQFLQISSFDYYKSMVICMVIIVCCSVIFYHIQKTTLKLLQIR